MAPTAELRQKHDALQGELSTRRSTTHYARAAVAILAGLLLSGTAGKMLHDAKTDFFYTFGTIIAVVAISLGAFAVFSYLAGRKAMRKELVRLAELRALRQELGLDDPGKMLPQR